jgi:hypothetical protein
MDDPIARFSEVHLSLLMRTPKTLGDTGGASLVVASRGPEIEMKAL